MTKKSKTKKQSRAKRPLLSNWLLYGGVLMAVAITAWLNGERLLYVALVTLAALPLVSLVLTSFMLRCLKVVQQAPNHIVKNESGQFAIHLHNPTPMPFGNVKCVFYSDHFAVEAPVDLALMLAPMQTTLYEVPFTVRYRGVYQVGLQAVQAMDTMGLFRLRRQFRKKVSLVVLPRVVEMTNFPLAMNLMTEANSRFDMRDEDYTTVSDVRPYLPSDSIKRVHWKLTAKRNEWLVKNFQSNALSKVTVILDNLKLDLRYREQIVIEDRMVEMALGLARFCLRRGMPVDLRVGEGTSVRCQQPAEFETIYHVACRMTFDSAPPFSPLTMLIQSLNEATGYINAVIMTSRLDAALYERIISGMNNGNYIAVLYFYSRAATEESEQVYRLLCENGMPCFIITDDSVVEEEA